MSPGYEPCVALGALGETLVPVFPVKQDGRSIIWRLPPRVGTGYFQTECLPCGLTLTRSRCLFENGFHARLRDVTDDFTLVFGLRGRSLNRNSFFKQGFELEAGSNYLYWFPDPDLAREAPKGERLDAVVITIPLDRLAGAGLIESGCPEMGEWMLEPPSRRAQHCFQKNVNSPAMAKVLEEILHCRLTGRARRFFLEGKALELVALKLDMISGTPVPAEGMGERHMQGVLAARDLLLKDLKNPPGIHDLARVAGMSHPRLGKFFKSVFGCSPFEMLRRKRLEWSLELVERSDMSLTEIAYEAGYANSSHFSKAFLDHYGIPPSQYRKRKAGSPFYSLPGPKA